MVVNRLFQKEIPRIGSSCSVLQADPRIAESLRNLAKNSLALRHVSKQVSLDSGLQSSLHNDLIQQLGKLLMNEKVDGKAKRRVISHSRVVRLSLEYLSDQIDQPVT